MVRTTAWEQLYLTVTEEEMYPFEPTWIIHPVNRVYMTHRASNLHQWQS